MKRCTLSKSQAFCNHAQVDEHFEYRSKTKVRKHNHLSLKQNVNQNDKAKNVLEKTTKLKFIFARKNLGTRNYSFWQVKMRFFFALHKSFMWTSLRNVLHFETIIVATFRSFVVRFVESILSCSALRVSCCVGYHRIFNKNNDNDKNIENGNDNDKKGSNSF